MSSVLTSLRRGFESWQWYRHLYHDPLGCLIEAHRRYGPVSVFRSPIPGRRRGQRYILAVGPLFNRQVLGKPDTFRPSGQMLKGPPGSAQQRLRRGILKMHGEEHRSHRRMMQPPFSKAAVASAVTSMAPLIDQVIDQWTIGEPLDIYEEVRTLSNWIAANVLFGSEDFNASVHVGEMIDRWVVLDAATRRLGLIERDLPGTPYRRELKHAERLEETIGELIGQKRRTGASEKDVLSLLIRSADSDESGMSDDDLMAHAIALYGASFETTAVALVWTMFLLAQHPASALRLHDEVSQELGEWPPDSRDLDSLPYLDAVVRESMRLLPPVPMTFRRVAEPCELAGIEPERDDKIVLSHFLTHRDPEAFPDPKRFDPTRWFAGRPDPYQYLPFSVGSRLCLGAVFAMTELKLVVARIMQKYRMSVVPDTRIDPVVHLVLKPKNALPMIAHKPDRMFRRVPVSGNIQGLVDLASAERA